MPAVEPLYYLIGINIANLSKEEKLLLEAELFLKICDELREIFRKQHRDYFNCMKFTLEMENTMLDANFIRLIIQDILLSEEYTLQGIARYIDTHEDVVHELAAGLNTKPLATYFRKTIELHRTVRHELYHAIGKKIAFGYLATTSEQEHVKI